jgi:NADH-quinone oxidoreductase subunit D
MPRQKFSLTLEEERISQFQVDMTRYPFHLEKQLERQGLFENIRAIGTTFPNAPICHELAFVRGIERLLEINPSPRSQCMRTILCEGERIINHIVTLGKIANSVGIFPLFMQTQHVQQQYEKLCLQIFGKRIPVDLLAPGVTEIDHIADFIDFFRQISSICSKIRSILISSRIFKARATNVAPISDVCAFSFTGVTARASGVLLDMRVDEARPGVTPILSSGGDVYARTVLFFDEVLQSLEVLQKCTIPEEHNAEKPSFVDVRNQRIFFSSEDIDLEQIDAGVYPIRRVYSVVEAPDGEFGISMIGNGENRLQRCKLNVPSFYTMQALERLAVGEHAMDLDMIVASLGL